MCALSTCVGIEDVCNYYILYNRLALCFNIGLEFIFSVRFYACFDFSMIYVKIYVDIVFPQPFFDQKNY